MYNVFYLTIRQESGIVTIVIVVTMLIKIMIKVLIIIIIIIILNNNDNDNYYNTVITVIPALVCEGTSGNMVFGVGVKFQLPHISCNHWLQKLVVFFHFFYLFIPLWYVMICSTFQ